MLQLMVIGRISVMIRVRFVVCGLWFEVKVGVIGLI